jgi:hypothetical protein
MSIKSSEDVSVYMKVFQFADGCWEYTAVCEEP